jgi:hypothetical protein
MDRQHVPEPRIHRILQTSVRATFGYLEPGNVQCTILNLTSGNKV